MKLVMLQVWPATLLAVNRVRTFDGAHQACKAALIQHEPSPPPRLAIAFCNAFGTWVGWVENAIEVGDVEDAPVCAGGLVWLSFCLPFLLWRDCCCAWLLLPSFGGGVVGGDGRAASGRVLSVEALCTNARNWESMPGVTLSDSASSICCKFCNELTSKRCRRSNSHLRLAGGPASSRSDLAFVK